MQCIRGQFGRFVSDESGATAVEYGLLLALLALAILGGVTAMGTAANNKFKQAATSLS